MVWPFRKEPLEHPQQLIDYAKLMRNSLAQINKQETEAYAGEMFPVTQEANMQETIVKTKTTPIEQLPILVHRSVDTLNDKRKELEQDLRDLKSKYDLERSELNDRLKKVNLAIRAWEAAKAVYDEDKVMEDGAMPEENGQQVEKPVRSRSSRRNGK